MPRVSFHGVTIAWSLAGLSFDPLAELFSMLEPESAGTASGGPILEAALRPAEAGSASDPRGEGWEASFFHGVVQAYRGAGGFLLWDGASRVRVPSGGVPAIEAEIADPEREIVPGTTSVVLQLALALALRPLGLFHLHAAALVLPSGTPVIVVGGSGAGKTTTTLSLLEAGADYLGDDALYLTAGPGGSVHVVAFPREFHLGPATLSAFPRLAPLAGAPSARGGKRPLDPRRAYPGRSRAAITLRPDAAGIALFPSVAPEPLTATAPLARADAFGHLLGSSGALVVAGAAGRDENLALLAALLAGLRCHELRLGADAVAASATPAGAVEAQIAQIAAITGPT